MKAGNGDKMLGTGSFKHFPMRLPQPGTAAEQQRLGQFRVSHPRQVPLKPVNEPDAPLVVLAGQAAVIRQGLAVHQIRRGLDALLIEPTLVTAPARIQWRDRWFQPKRKAHGAGDLMSREVAIRRDPNGPGA